MTWDELEGLASAALLLGPLILGAIAYKPARRGHWSALVLATPALLLGLALIAALFNDARGFGLLGAILYIPILLMVGGGAVVRWYRSRRFDYV
jgi:hypothetical protein